jgi:hypothetical protein
MVFYKVEHELQKSNESIVASDSAICSDCLPESKRIKLIRKGLLNVQDSYGNTLLHVAAWNEKTSLYDELIEFGADANISNSDGLTPFTLTARLGIWQSFNHIWHKHLTKTIWQFGSVKRQKSDLTNFDWRGFKLFFTRTDCQCCMDSLLRLYKELCDSNNCKYKLSDIPDGPNEKYLKSKEAQTNLIYKQKIAEQKAKDWYEAEQIKMFTHGIERWFASEKNRTGKPETSLAFDQYYKLAEYRTAIHMITLFRPDGWYDHTKDTLGGIILNKWSSGYRLVHVGQSLIPYCLIILIFVLMWSYRQLHILEYQLWWATSEATAGLSDLPPYKVLRNPVVADIPELLLLADEASVTGTGTFQKGQAPSELFGVESTCGWPAIRDSISGRLQAVQMIYGVLSLFRMAFTQRRVLPSDWDKNEDLIITPGETINFVYLNLEFLLHNVLCCLFIIIGVSRIAAGEKCTEHFVQLEQESTSISSLFIFLNLIAVCKPYEHVGLLLLATYKFIISDVTKFFIMYSTLFVGFLLAIQTLHNSERVYLAWLDLSPTIFQQVQAVTGRRAYLANSNIPEVADQLQDTHMSMGCSKLNNQIYVTALTLLQISFGDGLAGALDGVQQSDYDCAGFPPNPLLAYLITFWVFLTNVLILNMLIAMMNYTFDKQKQTVHSVWLLDISYRIMRYERLFPELIDRMQIHRTHYSFTRKKFWLQVFMDVRLVLYCLPEIHAWGMSHILWVWGKRQILRICACFHGTSHTANIKSKIDGKLEVYQKTVKDVVKKVKVEIEKQKLSNVNMARRRAGYEDIEELKETDCCGHWIAKIKGHPPEKALYDIAMMHDIHHEVIAWTQIVEAADPRSQGSVPESQVLVGDKVVHVSASLGFQTNANYSSSNAMNEGELQITDEIKTMLLLISLICRLDLLQQEFSESCTVFYNHSAESNNKPPCQEKQQTDAGSQSVINSDEVAAVWA